MAKGCGRRGNAKTQADIDQQRDDILAKNPTWKHVAGGTDKSNGLPLKEKYLPPVGGGRKGSSYPDLTFEKPDGTFHHHNTTDTYADGITETTREVANGIRIQVNDASSSYTSSPNPK
jgi:hypothetical protein